MSKYFFALTCVLFSLCLNAQPFQHTSTASNIEGGWTYLDHPSLNNNPQAIIQVEFVSGPSKGRNIGVWYNTARSKWAIFHQDRSAMQAGNVFRVNPTAQFVHRADKNNIDNYITSLDHPQLNNNPNASFTVTANWNPGGQGGIYDDHAISVSYKGGRWLIAHNDQAAIPAGAAFNIGITSGQPALVNNPASTTIVTAPALISLADANPGFENGLLNWRSIGTAFDNQPVESPTIASDRVLTRMAYSNGGIGGDYWKGLPYAIGVKGNKWIGTYENGNGDAPMGTLTSSPIKLTKRYLHFLLGGGKDINRIYVELQVKKSDYEASWGAGRRGFFGDTEDGYTRVNRITPLINSEELFRYYFDMEAELQKYENKTVRLRIVDSSSGSWGHINVDDIGQVDNLKSFIALQRDGFGLYADRDKPVWGFIDAHTHPAANLGFGGSLIWGKIDGPVNDALRHCDHGLLESAIDGPITGHNNKGWPVFSYWPSFQDKIHQTMHIDWLKRAYDGGMRLVAALAVNSTTVAFSLNRGTYSDAHATELQLQYLNEVFSKLPWAKICTTPEDARKAILENKMAVVLGIEVDNLEDFSTAEYIYRRNHGGAVSASNAYSLPLRPIDASAEGVGVGSESFASASIRRLMENLRSRNVVQINPIHFADNMVGGAAVYNRFFNEVSYQSTGEGYFVTDGSSNGFKYVLHKDSDDDMARLIGTGGNHLYRVGETMERNPLGHMNTKGLSNYGRLFVKEMARSGLIWDIDHASYNTTNEILAEARRYNYPLLSSHSDFSELYFTSPLAFTGDKNNDYIAFGTSNLHHLPHESQKTRAAIDAINLSGGMFNPIATLTNLKYESPLVANSCPGSSRTWAQKYLYVTERVPGKGVGLATDRGMLENVGPRFGNKAAAGYSKEEIVNEDHTRDARKELLIDFTNRRWKQENGVRYASPMRSIYGDMFRNAGEIYPFDDEMIFYMFASLIYQGGARSFNDITTVEKSDLYNRADGYLVRMTINAADFAGSGLNPGRFTERWKPAQLEHILKGMFAASESELTWFTAETGNPWEKAAAGYCLTHNKRPGELSNYSRFNSEVLNNFYNKMSVAWDMVNKMNGRNEPLRRCTTGYRDWDFNLDGIAHEGLLPDFIQDLKNVGVDAAHLQPLFRSAEEYIRMWEKAEAAKGNVRD